MSSIRELSLNKEAKELRGTPPTGLQRVLQRQNHKANPMTTLEKRKMTKKIYPNVKLGKDVIIEENCIIGKPPRGKKEGELSLEIGDNSHIRAGTVLYAGSRFGNKLQTGHNAMVRENNKVGNNCSVGTNAVLEPGNIVGDNTRIHSLCFLENTNLGKNVFLGPNVVFTDDLHPICPRFEECVLGAKIDDNSSVGANTTLMPGVKIGKNCLIGGGSTVTRDIPDNSVAAGVPAKVIKKTDELRCIKGFYDKPYEWRKE